MKLAEIVLALRNRDTVVLSIKCKKSFCLVASDLGLLSFYSKISFFFYSKNINLLSWAQEKLRNEKEFI